jgi:hypothetical protein
MFTQWWLHWNAKSKDDYPLPIELHPLTEADKDIILSQQQLPNKVDQAVEVLWNSQHQPIIKLMLKFFHMRSNLKKRNFIQHPTLRRPLFHHSPNCILMHSFFLSESEFKEQEKALGFMIQFVVRGCNRELPFTPTPGIQLGSNAGGGRRQKTEVDHENENDNKPVNKGILRSFLN